MVIFDGQELANQIKVKLKNETEKLLESGIQPKIVALVYEQDSGSKLYTSIKKETATELGIEYQAHYFSLTDGVEVVLKKIRQLNSDDTVTGIILQKPTRKKWAEVNRVEGKAKHIKQAYDLWWHLQTKEINPLKDVDGLHPTVLEHILNATLSENGRVMPATAKAVLSIIDSAKISLNNKKIAILGKSDLLGLPLLNFFLSKKYDVEILGRNELRNRIETGKNLLESDVVISATGVPNLIKGEYLKEGVVIIDVGEPKGDVDFASVKDKASFITPVPGGVGPMTVVSLMENCLELSKQ